MKYALLLIPLALAACSGPAPNGNVAAANAPVAANAAPPAAATTPDPRLARIFIPDALGANVAWLETITGPAFRTEGADNTYKLGDCTLIVGETKGKIDNLGIVGVTPACSFDIAQYFAEGPPAVPRVPTFGDIKRVLGGAYTADCLALCGNAADPVVTLTYNGSHADNFTTLTAQIPIGDNPELAAYLDWSAKLTAKYGEAAVAAGRFKDDDNLDAVASADFAAIKPTTVRVGSNLP